MFVLVNLSIIFISVNFYIVEIHNTNNCPNGAAVSPFLFALSFSFALFLAFLVPSAPLFHFKFSESTTSRLQMLWAWVLSSACSCYLYGWYNLEICLPPKQMVASVLTAFTFRLRDLSMRSGQNPMRSMMIWLRRIYQKNVYSSRDNEFMFDWVSSYIN